MIEFIALLAGFIVVGLTLVWIHDRVEAWHAKRG